MRKHQILKISKALSYVLRHNPQSIDIILDNRGWASVEDLLANLLIDKQSLDFETLKQVVDTNSKKRFSFNNDYTKIRANQGHSINIDLGYEQSKPPDILYHGTATTNMASILASGINKMNRQHVHLSEDVETAVNVGKRHGNPIVFKVDSKEMHKEGFLFYVTVNGVWLTETVPVNFLKLTNLNS